MKINILCSIDKRPSGPNRQLLEYGNYLYSKGHNVSVIKPVRRRCPKNRKDIIEMKLAEIAHYISGKRIREIKKLPWIDVRCPVKIIPSIDEKYLDSADILFFSMQASLPLVEKLSERCGRKVMRVCSVIYAENVDCIPENVYIVAISSIVKQILEKQLKREIFLLLNGVNTGTFYNSIKRKEPKTIGMVYYPSNKYKGMKNGFWVMEQLYMRYPSLKFHVIGEWAEKDIPPFVKFIDGNTRDNLINFYKTTDILIFPSEKEASPNPPMEAMASRCAVVTTEVGGISDYTIPGKTAIVVKIGDREGLLRGVINLIENNEYFRTISEEGYKKIQDFSVEKQGEKLEQILFEILKR
ncbi:MAG: glycosyltransferase family 4 protein [bacterium]|nr:glycosyltransferase family 4 protein [bacterium]